MLKSGVEVRVIQVVSNHHDIDIAFRGIRSLGDRAIDKGSFDFACKRFKSAPESDRKLNEFSLLRAHERSRGPHYAMLLTELCWPSMKASGNLPGILTSELHGEEPRLQRGLLAQSMAQLCQAVR